MTRPSCRYVVETRFFGDHWENCWSDEDGQPVSFATRAKAQAEIDEIVLGAAEAVASGDMLSAYFPDEFRIVAVPYDQHQ
jgi:hypothetical protein